MNVSLASISPQKQSEEVHPKLGAPHRQHAQEEASWPGEGTARTAHPTEVGSGYVRGGAAAPDSIANESLEGRKKLYKLKYLVKQILTSPRSTRTCARWLES